MTPGAMSVDYFSILHELHEASKPTHLTCSCRTHHRTDLPRSRKSHPHVSRHRRIRRLQNTDLSLLQIFSRTESRCWKRLARPCRELRRYCAKLYDKHSGSAAIFLCCLNLCRICRCVLGIRNGRSAIICLYRCVLGIPSIAFKFLYRGFSEIELEFCWGDYLIEWLHLRLMRQRV